MLKDKNVYSELLANDVDISESLVLMHSVKYGLKDFVKFTGKHQVWSLFSNTIIGLAYNFTANDRLKHRREISAKAAIS